MEISILVRIFKTNLLIFNCNTIWVGLIIHYILKTSGMCMRTLWPNLTFWHTFSLLLLLYYIVTRIAWELNSFVILRRCSLCHEPMPTVVHIQDSTHVNISFYKANDALAFIPTEPWPNVKSSFSIHISRTHNRICYCSTCACWSDHSQKHSTCLRAHSD